MVEARNFIPGSQIAFGIKDLFTTVTPFGGVGELRDNRECSRNCSNDGQNAHGIFLAVFLLSVDDNRKKKRKKGGPISWASSSILQLFKNAPAASTRTGLG